MGSSTGRANVLQEVLAMRFEEIYRRFHKGHLNCEAAADLFGISVSSFWRRWRRFEEEGLEGLVDARLDKANPTQVGRALAQPGIELIPAYTKGHYCPGKFRSC